MSSRQVQIVVGYDGTGHAALALDWAAAQAERQGASLLVLSVADHAVGADAGSWVPELVEGATIEIAAEGAARASRVAPLTHVSARTGHAEAAAALIEASRGAALVVVGSRGYGALAGAALGSVAFAVTARAHSPVVVVRGNTEPPGPGRMVVAGVDGSQCSDQAVLFAADAAAAAGAPLLIVGAYRSAAAQVASGAALLTLGRASAPGTVLAADGRESGPLDADGEASFDAIVRETGERAVVAASMIATRQHPGLTIIERVVQGAPVQVLAAAATGGLLVVGSRGRGALAGLTLGSVSHGVIHAAGCPVAVVRN